MELSNALIYGDRLCCGSAEVANATLVLSTSTSNSPWLRKVSVLFLILIRLQYLYCAFTLRRLCQLII